MRIKRGTTSRKRHKKILARAKGFRGGRSKLIKEAKTATMHAGADAYRGRREKKRETRSLWIIRLNAALSKEDISYSKFIHILKENKIDLDRKVLSQIALEDPQVFSEFVQKII